MEILIMPVFFIGLCALALLGSALWAQWQIRRPGPRLVWVYRGGKAVLEEQGRLPRARKAVNQEWARLRAVDKTWDRVRGVWR